MKLNLAAARIDASAFVADNATVFGNVIVGAEVTILFSAVVRGDTEAIRIGSQSNIQDLCVIHADPGSPCRIGNRVTVGHSAVIHGAVVEDDVLVGMRSVLMNGVHVGSGSIIAAGCVVPENTIIPNNSLVMGVPGKVRGSTDARHQKQIAHAAKHYVHAGQEYRLAKQSQEKTTDR